METPYNEQLYNKWGQFYFVIGYYKCCGQHHNNQWNNNSKKANNTANGGGQIFLNGSTGNRIDFANNGMNPPAFTTRSTGTKICLWSSISGSSVDYAIGIGSSNTLFQCLLQAQASTGMQELRGLQG